MPGIDAHRFRQQDLIPDYICCICRGVLVDPVQRPACKHFFCKQCIDLWLVERNTCPVDRQLLTPNYLVRAPQVLMDAILRLEVACKFEPFGCPKILWLSKLREHEDNCIFNPDYSVREKYEKLLQTKKMSAISDSSCSKILLKILEEKETIVQEQEKLISDIIEEGDDLSEVIQKFTQERDQIKQDREMDVSRLKQMIDKLEDENQRLRHRLHENRQRLVRESVASVQSSTHSSDESGRQSLSDMHLLLPDSLLLSPSPTGSQLQQPHFPSIRRSISLRSPRESIRRKNRCTSAIARRNPDAESEHEEVITRLKLKLMVPVYESMRSVDLADFYDFDPYKLTWVSYVADRIERLAKHITEGDDVLLLSCWNDLYIAATLAKLVGTFGHITTNSFSQEDGDKVARKYPDLILTKRLLLLPKGSAALPGRQFDVVIVTKEKLTTEIRTRLKQGGVAFDPYENKLIRLQDSCK